MKIFFQICLIFISGYVSAQHDTWYITRGPDTDEVAWAVDVDDSGNVYWAIDQKDKWPFWYYNVVVHKFDPSGNEIWKSTSWDNGTGFNDIAFLAKVEGNSLYLGGRTDSTANNNISGDALLMRYNILDGKLDWAKNITPWPDYGYQEIDGICVQPDGIYLTGWTKGQLTDMDFLIQKVDFSGNTIWVNSWDYNQNKKFDGANGHMAMDDRYIYTTGHVNRTNILSLDGAGVMASFDKTDGRNQSLVFWDGFSFDDPLGMTMSSDSMLYIVGYSASYGNGSQVYTKKITRSGEVLWTRLWGGSGTEDCRSVATDGDSIVYVVGATGSYGHGGKDVFVLKYDVSGTLLDSLIWGGAYDETAKDVVFHEGYLFITGETKSFGNALITGDHTKTDGLLLKIDGRRMRAPDVLINDIAELKGENHPNITAFPNPFTHNFILKTDFSLINASLYFFNLTGQYVRRTDHLSGNSILVEKEDLVPGLYFFRLMEGMDELATGKIVLSE
ncbi:MAG TPA: hypothetical protein DCX89_04800 [Saprospirales bacterium]|nr:hypothetical protein [Saprospirales bacterium]HAY71188.1 hypothetical protein [Saprospirales bacterium]HRQ28646.1 T9SS type A sorting domain-containing protein [Saprospiraceae bacterium]